MDIVLNHFRNYLNNDLLYISIVSGGVIVLIIFVGKILSPSLRKFLQPLVERSKTDLDDQIFELLKSTFFKLVVLAGFYAGLGVFKNGLTLKSGNPPQTLLTYHPYFSDVVIGTDYVLFVVIVLILLFVAFKAVNIFFTWYSSKVDAGENKNLSGSLFPLLQKISKLLLTALAFVIVLSKFHIDISGFIVSLGVGSLAIALAAQETISNMISGFIIMTDRPFRIGDRIRINPDLVGDVVEIGIRSTKILDFDNNIVIVPNNDIVKSRIVNLTYPSSMTRVVVQVGVSYESDVEKVKRTMVDVARNHPLVAESPSPDVLFLQFGDSSINFNMTAFTEHYQDAVKIASELREGVLVAFRKENIEIPFQQMDVRFRKNEGN